MFSISLKEVLGRTEQLIRDINFRFINPQQLFRIVTKQKNKAIQQLQILRQDVLCPPLKACV